jgi:hypothetical protein
VKQRRSVAVLALCCGAWAAAADTPAAGRVEARSQDMLAVGVISGERMSIHLSQLMDNAPVRDAAVTVLLRGATHPTTAETDGSFTLSDKDLAVPGDAAIEFQIAMPTGNESLKGTIKTEGVPAGEEKGTSRQLWWWVLNFGACIGFLWLFSRRKKAAAD